MHSKADLHVHSKYSDRPSEWFLRRVGAPESYTEPVEVYFRCKAAGMQFVTISDHNRIDAALEIAHLPDTFISSELTTYFPEDGCKIHMLVVGIGEDQFHELDRLRENIYDLRNYCLTHDIVHSVAHPLFSVNDRLSVEHFEKLIVMFKRFEGVNGARDPRACQLANTIFNSLTPGLIEELAHKHGLEPTGPKPWGKWFTGGSDDHGGQYIAEAYTTTPRVDTVEQFIDHLRRGEHEMAGGGGTSLRLAHSFYHIAYRYYRSRLVDGSASGSGLMNHLLERLISPEPRQVAPGLAGKLREMVEQLAMSRRRRKLNDLERLLVDEFRGLTQGDAKASESLDDRRTFTIASRISHQLGYNFTCKLVESFRRGDLIESLQTFASLGPVALGVAPYVAAMKTQHKDERLLQLIASRFAATRQHVGRSGKRAWATDTYADVNGVTTTIRAMAGLADRRGLPLKVLTCHTAAEADETTVRNFEPVGTFELPEYEHLQLAFPPFLDMMQYMEAEQFDEVIISTPGPVGLTALTAANLLGMRKIGIYHTDFPQYVRKYTQDANLEALTWRYMHWFYEQMDLILVPSVAYRRKLVEAGFEADKLHLMRRGVDLERFSPALRSHRLFKSFGLRDDRFTFLYVGRVSTEKNIDRLLADFRSLVEQGVNAQLAIVGDGPALKELRRKYDHPQIGFLGCLTGIALSQAYASADAMVFPSTTDTFGNVVLEAMASGLPPIVTDQGGPAEIVRHDTDGLVVDLEKPRALIDAMRRICDDTAMRQRLRHNAMESARAWTWDAALDELWRQCDKLRPQPAEQGNRRSASDASQSIRSRLTA